MRQAPPPVVGGVGCSSPAPVSARVRRSLPLGAGTFVRTFRFPAPGSCGRVSLPTSSKRSPNKRCGPADRRRRHHLRVHGRRQWLEREGRRQGHGGRQDATERRRQTRRARSRADRRQAAATDAASAVAAPIPAAVACWGVVEAAAQVASLKRRWQRNGGRQGLAANERGRRQETAAGAPDTTDTPPDAARAAARANGAAPPPPADAKIRQQRVRGGST